jgi:hypothetical protein
MVDFSVYFRDEQLPQSIVFSLQKVQKVPILSVKEVKKEKEETADGNRKNIEQGADYHTHIRKKPPASEYRG